jgi:hypothetical protein
MKRKDTKEEEYLVHRTTSHSNPSFVSVPSTWACRTWWLAPADDARFWTGHPPQTPPNSPCTHPQCDRSCKETRVRTTRKEAKRGGGEEGEGEGEEEEEGRTLAFLVSGTGGRVAGPGQDGPHHPLPAAHTTHRHRPHATRLEFAHSLKTPSGASVSGEQRGRERR